MARKNPVPQREKDIGNRIRQFRRLIVISRVGLAKELNVGLPRLASYEIGAVPVPYHFAKLLDYTFGLNYEWLATGNGEPRDSIPVRPEVEIKIPNKWAFSKVFDEFIKPNLAEKKKQPEPLLQKHIANLKGIKASYLRGVGIDKASTIKAMMAGVFGAMLEQLPPHLYWSYYRKLLSSTDEFHLEHITEIAQAAELETMLSEEREKINLTTVSESDNIRGVKDKLPSLLKRLKVATAQRGKKSELAKFLGVSLVQVSQWLTGDREPGGETTLRLLHWVEQQERQK